MPDIPAQADPWNNEYRISVTTRYTEHGTPRTGIYRRRLRTPLAVAGIGSPPPVDVGILTGDAAAPCVTVIGGSLVANETLRIQVILDVHEDELLFSLLDMQEKGKAGTEIAVAADGEVTLLSFSGSAVIDLIVLVNDYAALKEMIRNDYSGRLVDILDIRS